MFETVLAILYFFFIAALILFLNIMFQVAEKNRTEKNRSFYPEGSLDYPGKTVFFVKLNQNLNHCSHLDKTKIKLKYVHPYKKKYYCIYQSGLRFTNLTTLYLSL
jgi:hypothetical protein